MKRVEFKLSMPGVNSWDGRWSGEGRNYVIYKNLRDDTYAKMLGETYWHYNFGDGWAAGVGMRVMNEGEKRKKSDGFYGYDWMVDSILWYNKILNTVQQRELREAKEENNNE